MQVNQTKYLKIIFKKVIAFIFTIFFLIIGSFYAIISEVQKETFDIQYSKNPEASAKFANAMEYRIIIESLHKYLNYDNFIMIFLINQMNDKFKEGKELLPKDSIEDILWWMILNRNMFFKSDDLSYAKYVTNTYKDEFFNEIYSMIERLPYGKNYFDNIELNQNRFATMLRLVSIYTDLDIDRFIYYLKEESNKHDEIYKHLDMAYKRYFDSQKSKEYFYYIYINTVIMLHAKDIYLNLQGDENGKMIEPAIIPQDLCYKKDIFEIYDNFQKIIDYVKTTKNYSSSLSGTSLEILGVLENSCPNEKELRKKIQAEIDEINKNKKGVVNAK
ncbi:hypothetical protein KJQ97_09255 [Campylobacter sp. 2018MI01]|uniref:hypothetical protein n=1 Tax=Campylobacter sp. 2018MI01 TaxID=2836735 RepID=UPI001BDB3F3E|nr:hypothetical protein [Campylobacter sp. 2018MI01]MBT0879610.1 hypothetical protein [Campylobacter sp. 2018MI01]